VAFFLFPQRFYWASLIKIRMRFEKLEHEQESLLLHRFPIFLLWYHVIFYLHGYWSLELESLYPQLLCGQ
jgi:hypothetical protein